MSQCKRSRAGLVLHRAWDPSPFYLIAPQSVASAWWSKMAAGTPQAAGWRKGWRRGHPHYLWRSLSEASTQHFSLYPSEQNLVTWPNLDAREWDCYSEDCIYRQKLEVLSPWEKEITSNPFCIANYYYNIQITRNFRLRDESGWNADTKSGESVRDSMLKKRMRLKQKNKSDTEVTVEHEGRKKTDSEFKNYLEPTR